MDNQGLKNHVYHVSWSHNQEEHIIGKKICHQTDTDATMLNYRLITNGKQLKNTLKKYFETQEKVDAALKKGTLRIVLGVEVSVAGILLNTEG